jgi:hypothetical protein
MSDSLYDFLKEIASKKVRREQEDFNAYDWSGGQPDDAWDMGAEDGRIELAQELLEKFFEAPYIARQLENDQL